MKKTKIRTLKDIEREKQKARQVMALQEYALEMQYKELKHKLSFASISGYALGLLKNHFNAKLRNILVDMLSSLFSRKSKSR